MPVADKRTRLLAILLATALLAVLPVQAGDSALQMVTQLAFSPDGRLLAAAGTAQGARFANTGLVEVRAVSDRKLVCSLPGAQSFRSLAFRADGKVLVTGSEDSSVVLWSLPAGKKLIGLKGCPAHVWDVAFSPDGKKVAAASGWSGGLVVVWSAGSGAQLFSQSNAADPFYSVAFSPDGKILASGDRLGRTALWDASTGSLIRELKGPPGWVTQLAFDPGGRSLAAASGNEIRLYELSSGKLLKTLQDNQSISSLEFFPQGDRLLAGRWDSGVAPSTGSVRVWELDSGKPLLTFGEGNGRVCSALSGDGSIVAAQEEGNTVARFFDSATGQPIQNR